MMQRNLIKPKIMLGLLMLTFRANGNNPFAHRIITRIAKRNL